MEMSDWQGAAGICFNEKKEVLLVLQGPPDEPKQWSLPAGGIEGDETPEEACVREFREVAGLDVEVVREVGVRDGEFDQGAVSIKLHYFLVKPSGDELHALEDDLWVERVAWMSLGEAEALQWTYPDELERIRRCLV